jgi:hypothetical protein
MAYQVALPVVATRSVRTAARITVTLLAATMLVGAWRIVTAARGADDDAPTLTAALVFVLTALAFIQWLHRVRRNLESLGFTGLRWSPAWSVGAWLIPIANLVIPLLIVNEIDEALQPPRAQPPSEGDARRDNNLAGPATATDRPRPPQSPRPTLGRWVFLSWAATWTVYAIPNFGFVQGRIPSGAMVALGVVGLAAATCAILLVRRITANQAALPNTVTA